MIAWRALPLTLPRSRASLVVIDTVTCHSAQREAFRSRWCPCNTPDTVCSAHEPTRAYLYVYMVTHRSSSTIYQSESPTHILEKSLYSPSVSIPEASMHHISFLLSSSAHCIARPASTPLRSEIGFHPCTPSFDRLAIPPTPSRHFNRLIYRSALLCIQWDGEMASRIRHGPSGMVKLAIHIRIHQLHISRCVELRCAFREGCGFGIADDEDPVRQPM
jgi:hypothetical protein